MTGNNRITLLGRNSKNSRHLESTDQSAGSIEVKYYQYKSGDECCDRVWDRIVVTSVTNGENYDRDQKCKTFELCDIGTQTKPVKDVGDKFWRQKYR